MDRAREFRKVPMAVAGNGLSRRRHRAGNFRDFPEESSVELPEAARLRDRGGSSKKDRDQERDRGIERKRERDRERDRLSNRSKRRREERLMMVRCNLDNGGNDSSDESVTDDEEYEEPPSSLKMLPPPSNNITSSFSSSLSNHRNGGGASGNLRHHNNHISNHQRKNFPAAKNFRSSPSPASQAPVSPLISPWKAADEMIGVPVPRKARSACTKRPHESWTPSTTGGGGFATGEQIHRQVSTSPANRVSPTSILASPSPPAPTSPALSSDTVRRKMSSGKKQKPLQPKLSSCKLPSPVAVQDEIEIEIAEVLYGMMTMPLATSKQESAGKDSRDVGAKAIVEVKPRISSPISDPQTAPLSSIAPKRKKPRHVKDDDENDSRATIKSEAESSSKSQVRFGDQIKSSGSAEENSPVLDSTNQQPRESNASLDSRSAEEKENNLSKEETILQNVESSSGFRSDVDGAKSNSAERQKPEIDLMLDVVSILDFGYDVDDEWDLTWPEDVEDYRVDNLVRCIREGYNFKDDDFQGGVVPIVESSSEVEEVRKPKKQRKRAARPPPVPSSPKTQVPEGTPRRMTRSYTKAKGKAPETGESSKVEGEGDLEPDELYEAVRGVFSRLESRVNQEIKQAEVEALKLMVRGVAVKEEIIHKMVKEFMERDGMGSGPRFRKVDTEIPDGGSDKDVCKEPDIEDVTDKDKDAGDEKDPAMETEPGWENEATREEAAREKEASREKQVADERIRATLEDLATGEKEKSREGNQEETAVQMDISSGEDVRKGPGKNIEEVEDESSSEEFESSTDDEVEEIKHPGPTQPGTVNPASSSVTPARPSAATPVKPPNPVSVCSQDATVSSPLKQTVASPVKSKTSVGTEVETSVGTEVETSALKASSAQMAVQTNVESSPPNKDVRKTDNVSIPVNEGSSIPESVEGQVGGVVSEGTGNVDQLGTKETDVASSMLEVDEKGEGDPKDSEEESDGDGEEGNEDESESEEGDSEEDDEVPTPVPQEKAVVDVPSGGRGKRLKFKSAKIRTPESEKRKDVVPEEEGYDPLGFVSGPKKKAFLAKIKQYKTEEVDVNGYGQKEIFFQRIYRPKNYVDNDHMDAMLSLIWDRQGDVFLERRVAIMDSFFMQYLKTEYEKYKSLKKGGTVPWSRTIRNHVRGASQNRYGSLRWLVDVDVVYTPLNVGGNHWVAVVIKLVEGTVTVLDCLASITTEAKMKTTMKPYLEALPILLRDLNTSGKPFPQKFTYAGRPEVLQNVRGGDCGPLTVKFIEMDGQGKALDEVTEDIIDELRLKYAVDIFEEYVEPVFSPKE